MPCKPWSYTFRLRGTINGEFLSASGRAEGVEGAAEVSAVIDDGAPLRHSTWIWGSFAHFGLAFMPDGKVKNPCDSHPHHVTRHWRGEDGAHIWSTHDVSGVEAEWIGDINCLGETFDEQGPIMRRKVLGQLPSHWVATARNDKEINVHGLMTYQLEGGSSYTVHIHDEIVFEEPCVELSRHYWKLEILDGEYHPDHWWHKEVANVDSCWNFGPTKDRMSFTWSLFGSINDKCIEASGFGHGFGFRQHQWGKGGKGFEEGGLPNLTRALAWEGHAGIHFFTKFPRGIVNPFILSLPEGFVVNRKWFGQDGAHWTSTHDVRFSEGMVSKKIVLVGAGFPENGIMMTSSSEGKLIMRSFPQYVVAVPKSDGHIWYRSPFQFQLNDGSFYSGYWEMDVHCRKKVQMPPPYVVKFVDETWENDGHSWSFYEREEVEPSTYDLPQEREKRPRAMTGSIRDSHFPPSSDSDTPQIQFLGAKKEKAIEEEEKNVNAEKQKVDEKARPELEKPDDAEKLVNKIETSVAMEKMPEKLVESGEMANEAGGLEKPTGNKKIEVEDSQIEKLREIETVSLRSEVPMGSAKAETPPSVCTKPPTTQIPDSVPNVEKVRQRKVEPKVKSEAVLDQDPLSKAAMAPTPPAAMMSSSSVGKAQHKTVPAIVSPTAGQAPEAPPKASPASLVHKDQNPVAIKSGTKVVKKQAEKQSAHLQNDLTFHEPVKAAQLSRGIIKTSLKVVPLEKREEELHQPEKGGALEETKASREEAHAAKIPEMPVTPVLPEIPVMPEMAISAEIAKNDSPSREGSAPDKDRELGKESEEATTEQTKIPIQQKPAKKFRPRVFQVPAAEPPPPLLKPPQIKLKQERPASKKEPIVKTAQEMPQTETPSNGVLPSSPTIERETSRANDSLQIEPSQSTTIEVSTQPATLNGDEALQLAAVRIDGHVEVDYSVVDVMSTSEAQICLSPRPIDPPSKTVKWKITDLVNVAQI